MVHFRLKWGQTARSGLNDAENTVNKAALCRCTVINYMEKHTLTSWHCDKNPQQSDQEVNSTVMILLQTCSSSIFGTKYHMEVTRDCTNMGAKRLCRPVYRWRDPLWRCGSWAQSLKLNVGSQTTQLKCVSSLTTVAAVHTRVIVTTLDLVWMWPCMKDHGYISYICSTSRE